MGWPIAYIPTFRIPIFALALLLTACGGFAALTLAQQIDIACESASSATMIITVMKAQGQLSASQITRVDQAVDLIDPVCGAAIRPTTVTALDTVNRALLTLNGVKLAPQRPTGG